MLCFLSTNSTWFIIQVYFFKSKKKKQKKNAIKRVALQDEKKCNVITNAVPQSNSPLVSLRIANFTRSSSAFQRKNKSKQNAINRVGCFNIFSIKCVQNSHQFRSSLLSQRRSNCTTFLISNARDIADQHCSASQCSNIKTCPTTRCHKWTDSCISVTYVHFCHLLKITSIDYIFCIDNYYMPVTRLQPEVRLQFVNEF